MSQEFTCYIDESGDEGFVFREHKSSSDWFFLTGVITTASEETIVRGSIDTIIQKIWVDKGLKAPDSLHWRDLTHERKVVVIQELQKLPFVFISVGLWKTKFDRAGFIRQRDNMYNYATKLLLERVSWYIKDQSGIVRITLSNRTRFKREYLKSYLMQLKLNRQSNIEWQTLDIEAIRLRATNTLRMLQIADQCAGATFNAFNPDDYGNTHPMYLQGLRSKLFRRRNVVWRYGLKFMPDDGVRTEYPFVDKL